METGYPLPPGPRAACLADPGPLRGSCTKHTALRAWLSGRHACLSQSGLRRSCPRSATPGRCALWASGRPLTLVALSCSRPARVPPTRPRDDPAHVRGLCSRSTFRWWPQARAARGSAGGRRALFCHVKEPVPSWRRRPGSGRRGPACGRERSSAGPTPPPQPRHGGLRTEPARPALWQTAWRSLGAECAWGSALASARRHRAGPIPSERSSASDRWRDVGVPEFLIVGSSVG